ncbi:hypothetical protein CWI84_00455 [Idiomarina tyrosinivorans]|uniref:Uncharacterized protein n=1 Tax=Idiomarina tyrosinivorans TaxID=1445662 RepID=A0A432ZTM6_9GAMM|nr:energy transducer TonB [Idiomarina tyrosinivorans]RUO81267.1 hypothetical protein CWI84_00455 [Idiomarina tyrosinivorans]
MKVSFVIPIVATAGMFLGGCQSVHHAEKPDSYLDLTKGDFALRDYWIPNEDVGGSSLFFPDVLYDKSLDGCAVIEFGINSNGEITGYKPLYSFPSEDVAQAAGAHIAHVGWKPGPKNNEAKPALGKIFFAFKLKGGSRNRQDYLAHCVEKYL